MESGPGPADPALSNIQTTLYTGTGYGAVGQGTIGAGEIATATPGPPAAQVRMYVQGSNLIILDNISGQAFSVPASAAIQPPNYSPTK